jgi:hypothetical protein
MVTDKKLRFIVEMTVNEEQVADSPYWPLAAKGTSHEAAIARLVEADIQARLEDIPYVESVKVTESYD